MLLNDGLYYLDKSEHIVAGSASCVYNEACVLFADLSAAYRSSLKAAFVDKCGGIEACGTLKGASCGGKIQGLTCLAL